jgi:ubiquinone/menaquinone biosynthesis C-methylase UbiE
VADAWQKRANERFRGEGYAEYYEGRYRSFLKGTLKHRMRCAVLRRAFRDVPAGSVVLDVPCGTGRFTGFLLSRGYRVVGADIAPEMIRVAKGKAADIPGILGWASADATRMPLPDKSVDSVLTMRLFHLIPGDVRPLIYREFARVCRGQLVLCFNCNKWALKHLGKRLRGKTPEYLMTRKELTKELLGAGLKVERIHTKGFGPFSTLWAVVCRPA